MPFQRNPNAGKFHLPAGYTDIGWQVLPSRPEKVACRDAGHKTRLIDNSPYLNRGTDYITICDECRYIHHTDMSD